MTKDPPTYLRRLFIGGSFHIVECHFQTSRLPLSRLQGATGFDPPQFFSPSLPAAQKKDLFWAKGGKGRGGIEGETSPSISAPFFIRRLHRGKRRESGLTGKKKTGVARQEKMLDDLFHLSIFPRRASFWIQGSETQSFWAAAWSRGEREAISRRRLEMQLWALAVGCWAGCEFGVRGK